LSNNFQTESSQSSSSSSSSDSNTRPSFSRSLYRLANSLYYTRGSRDNHMAEDYDDDVTKINHRHQPFMCDARIADVSGVKPRITFVEPLEHQNVASDVLYSGRQTIRKGSHPQKYIRNNRRRGTRALHESTLLRSAQPRYATLRTVSVYKENCMTLHLQANISSSILQRPRIAAAYSRIILRD